MIYLGYDPIEQRVIVNYGGMRIVCRDSNRARTILTSLYVVSEKALGVLPYTRKVKFFDQAWSDLLSVAR